MLMPCEIPLQCLSLSVWYVKWLLCALFCLFLFCSPPPKRQIASEHTLLKHRIYVLNAIVFILFIFIDDRMTDFFILDILKCKLLVSLHLYTDQL